MSKVRTPEPDGFSEFWDIWRPYMRHTDGRADARDGYRKHILAGADPQDIIDGARGYLRQLAAMKPEERKFIPLAKSWLNKESYLDWCDRERAYQERLREGPKQPDRTNVVNLQQPEKRLSEAERRAQVASLLPGFAAQG